MAALAGRVRVEADTVGLKVPHDPPLIWSTGVVANATGNEYVCAVLVLA